MVLVVALALGAAVAEAAPTRRIEASATGAELSAALLPADTPEYLVCAGDCPPGLGRVGVLAPRLAVHGAVVEARGRVRTELAVVGAVEADVVCAVVPVLLDGARVHVRSRGCRIERLGNVSTWLRAGVIAVIEPALAVLVEEQLRVSPAYDLLGGARDGLLAPYSADPALRAPQAAGCVQGIGGVTVRDGAPGRLVVAVDVACG
jgi:hypothetical protein